MDDKGAKLQNAHDVVELLTWKMSNDGKNRLFIEVRVDEVDRKKSYVSRLGGMTGMRLSTKREQERKQDHKIINDK